MTRNLKRIESLMEQIRLHKIRIAMIEQQNNDLLNERFPEDSQRKYWEKAWNVLYNEDGRDHTQEIALLAANFKIIPNTQFTQNGEEKV